MTAAPATANEAPDPCADAVKVQRGIDAPLRALLLDAFGLDIADPVPVHGGEEAATWKVTADGAAWIVRISPTWRTVAELEWVYDVVGHVARVVPEVPMPRRTRHSTWTVTIDGHTVTVHPFVAGSRLDWLDSLQREAAATLLARVHRAFEAWPGRRERPGGQPLRPVDFVTDPSALADLDLDRWLEDLPRFGLACDLIHRDVYPRNLLWRDSRIAALVDWDELAVDWREQEVAWTIWEFCQDEAGTDLDLPAAARLLAAYEQAGGVVAPGFAALAASCIRRRLRIECVVALVARAAGRPFDAHYLAAGLAAFANLRNAVVG